MSLRTVDRVMNVARLDLVKLIYTAILYMCILVFVLWCVYHIPTHVFNDSYYCAKHIHCARHISEW